MNIKIQQRYDVNKDKETKINIQRKKCGLLRASGNYVNEEQ